MFRNVPEGIPETGVYTSDQGKVMFNGLELLKISEASVQVMNNVAVYRETGLRTGTTYAGNLLVRGNVSRAFINFGEARIAAGFSIKEGTSVIDPDGATPNVLTLTTETLTKLLAVNMGVTGQSFPYGDKKRNFYPAKFELQLDVNRGQMPASGEFGQGRVQTLIVTGCMFEAYSIAINSRGHVISGPMPFIGEKVSWSYE